MNDSSDANEVRFYFSFRSPYAWLAFHMVPDALGALPVSVRRLPVFPPPTYPNDPTGVPAKLAYMMEHDVPRVARGLGLTLRQPASTDVAWMGPHAMWMYAEQQGHGQAFGEAVFAARFSEGKDLANSAVFAEAATRAGLAPDAVLAAADDEAMQTLVMQGMIGGVKEGLFGVPYFVYRGERFWGHDRISTLVGAIKRHVA